MRLEIRLLGTVELRVNGRVVTPAAGKQRALLAGLALAANRSVSLGQLVEMVWADVPPVSAMSNLRSHAAGLRRLLGDRLVARRKAYELVLEPDELDVIEFQRLAEEGRGRLLGGESTSAVPVLSAALGLWRGAAGDGVPRGTALDIRWVSLEEQRLQVFEELSEARLVAGKHGDLLSDLREHLAAFPLRERAWGQLMLALYRCGDVPGALAAYRDARAALGEQLGVEPGEELAALHRAILDRAPEVSCPRTSSLVAASPMPVVEPGDTGVVGWVVPRELPPDLVTFVGRSGEIADVVAAVTAAAPAVAVISGPPGCGKTAVAVRAAHAVTGDFPDGQVFVDLGCQSSVGPDEVLARVLRTLGVAPGDVPDRVDERVGRFRSLAAGRRLLLVVDGVTGAAQVRPLLPVGPGLALIVVGQRYLGSLDGVRRVAVRMLDLAEAGDLLAAFAGADRLAADPAATADLVRLCGGSVLALRVAAARLARWPGMPVVDLVGQLADVGNRLDVLTYDDLSVRASVATAVRTARTKDEVAGALLDLLGATSEALLAVDGAAAQLGVSGQRVRQALDVLADAYLVDSDESGGFRLAPFVGEYVAELAVERSEQAHPSVILLSGPAGCGIDIHRDGRRPG